MKRMIIMCGVPRSGKNTYIDQYVSSEFTSCSADDIRAIIGKDKSDMTNETQTWKIHDTMLEMLLLQNKDVIVNNTNITKKVRAKYISMAQKYGYSIIGIEMNTPLDVCLDRSEKTNFPKDVVKSMKRRIQSLELEEGFDKIKLISATDEI